MRRAPLDVDGIATIGAMVARISNLGVGLIEAGSRRRGKVARAYLAGWVVLSIAGLADIAVHRRFRRGWILADAALAVATNLSERAWDDDEAPVELRYQQMASLFVSAAATADFAPVAVLPTVVACASWSWGLAGLRRRRPEFRVPVLSASLEPLITACTIAVVARRLRAIEAEMGELRERTRQEAETAVVEIERERRHRLLHDTALQTLEAVSGDWYADDESLRALAAADARLLRVALTESGGRRDLESALVDLVGTYRDAGLAVELETRTLGRCGLAEAEELVAAAREAMVNSLKHAGPCTTRVVAECLGSAVVVTVADDGAGFDTADTPEGYGIGHSIKGRVSALDGTVQIDSAPGRGTVVRMCVPLR